MGIPVIRKAAVTRPRRTNERRGCMFDVSHGELAGGAMVALHLEQEMDAFLMGDAAAVLWSSGALQME